MKEEINNSVVEIRDGIIMSKIGMKNGKRVRNLLVIVAFFFLVGSFSTCR